MKIRNLFEASKTAVLAFGRMNPPTIGHKKLADKVASISGDPYIFVTQSQKPKTDPLAFADKLKFAQASFPNVKVGSSDVKTIIQALQKLEAMGYDSIVYVAGSDRIQDFTTLINKYNGKEYKFKNIQVVSAGNRDPDAEGAEGMSASKMRAAAATGDFDSFQQGVANPKIAQKMYDAVRKGMGVIGEGTQINNPKNTFLSKSDTAYDFLRVGKTISNLSNAKKSDNRDEPDVMIVPFGGKKEKDHLKKGLKKSGYKTQDADKDGDDAHVDEAIVYEGYKLQLERDKELLVLNITDTKTGKRTEVRGKPGYESGGYDPKDKLHILLDKVGKSVDISQLMNGEPVGINPKHPTGASAKAATDTAYSEDKSSCPPATQDLELNTKNRDATLKNFNYGPLNVSEPGDYWEKIAKYWKTDVEAALASNCGNCVAFDISPRMDDCMPGETSDEDGRLGYCWMHHFKCHSARSCHTWAKGGPIEDDEKSLDWQKRGEDKVEENFADGKKKGKSRPGRVKKAGASCNGSVTALRKRAKNASGEKAKMYHWCANMKSGKKK